MTRLVLESWILLTAFEADLYRGRFAAVDSAVRKKPTRKDRRFTVEVLCRAMDLACVFYVKRVFCLQRAAATTILLRRHGWPAEMVIGAQVMPFKSHAWVEVQNEVVNDKPYVSEMYLVLQRC